MARKATGGGDAAARSRTDAASVRRALQRRLDQSDALRELHVFESLPSTNTWLGERAPGPPGRLDAAIALHQTAGRGRRGSAWIAPAGSGLCLSVRWTYASIPPAPSALTLALGLAAATALDSLGVQDIELKWPNDLVRDGRKLGGVLVESAGANGGMSVVAGIGINVRLPDAFALPDAGAGWYDGVTDLAAAGVDASITDAAAAVIPAFAAALRRYGVRGFAPLAADYNRRNWLRGRTALSGDECVRCGDVDASGRLETDRGPISSGELLPVELEERPA